MDARLHRSCGDFQSRGGGPDFLACQSVANVPEIQPCPTPTPTVSSSAANWGKGLPGLAKPPFPNELGQWIYENVSKDAWDRWLQESVRYINTYGWELNKPEDAERLVEQLRIWLGLDEGEMLQTAWTPPRSE